MMKMCRRGWRCDPGWLQTGQDKTGQQHLHALAQGRIPGLQPGNGEEEEGEEGEEGSQRALPQPGPLRAELQGCPFPKKRNLPE